MPNKKRKITTIEDVEDEQESVPILSEEDEQSIEALENFSSSFGPKEVRYRIHKIEMGKRIFKWTDTAAPQDWEQWIQQQPTLGGGEYEISATAPNQMTRSFRVFIGDLPQNNPAAGGSTDSFLIKELLRRIDVMESRLTQPATSTSVRELVEGLKGIQEINGGGGSKLSDALELAKVILDAGREASGRPNTVMDAVVDIAKEVGKPLVQVAANLLASRGAQPNNEVVQVQSQPNIDEVMKQGIQWLKKQALAGVDPLALLHIVEANATEYEPFIRYALDREFEVFATIDPEISSPTYVGFFRALYDGLRSDFAKANPVDANPSGAGGDVSDINSNGKTSKRRK